MSVEKNVAMILIAKYECDIEGLEKDIGIIRDCIQQLKKCVEE